MKKKGTDALVQLKLMEFQFSIKKKKRKKKEEALNSENLNPTLILSLCFVCKTLVFNLRERERERERETEMPGPTVEMEAVEPQSLKKLSFKSLKRALDLFSPLHSHLAPPDPERF